MVILHKDNPVGGADMLNSLADVNINNPEDKQILLYDNATRTWRNYEPSFVDKDNVLSTVEECSASTNPEDVAGASAISALNSSIEWKYAGDALGGVAIQIPSTAKEVHVVAQYGSPSGLQSQVINFFLTKRNIGYVNTSGANTFGVQVVWSSNNTITLVYYSVDSVDFTSTSKIYVEYK